MAFRTNNYQQISLFDKLGFLSDRKLKMLRKSWAQVFSDHVFTHINEQIFAPLYSEKTNSRPNAPINVIIGALILKEFSGLTEDELLETCEFDYRFQYALHTTSFEEQPLSDRTFSRFRQRCAEYEVVTGIDLIHECFVQLADDIRQFMDISPNITRMDSMMIESNIRKMGRLELLYTCLSNLVKEIHSDGDDGLIKGLEHYWQPNDRNKVVYYASDVPQEQRLQSVIDDAVELLPKAEESYGDTTEYQLLKRALSEQTKKDDNDHVVPKIKEDGMDSSILQNPSDPDATFRSKAGKQYRGYAANITEAVDSNGSIPTDYQFDVNTRSDHSFIEEVIEKKESDEHTTIIADGAYSGDDIQEKAAEKNIGVITTGLLGRKPREILADFKLSDDGKNIISCPEGHSPRSSSYIHQTDSTRVSFLKEHCKGCPHLDECKAKLKERTSFMIVSLNARQHAIELIDRKSDEIMTIVGRIRNGVETIPSVLRRKYNVDEMPVRGKLRTGQFFGIKMHSLIFSKLLRYTQGLEKCRPLSPQIE